MKKEEVFQDLKRKIVFGEIAQGTWLTERELCATYGISRTPVREILWNLCSVNLAFQAPDKGCRVRTFSINDIIEVYNVREAVEASCARLACLSNNPHYIEEIDDLLEHLENVDAFTNLDEAIKYGVKVHEFTRRECNNRYLLDFYNQIADVTLLLNNIAYTHREIEEESRQGHIAILKALRKRDQSGSAKAMMDHLKFTCQHIVDVSYSNLQARIAE